MPRHTGLIAHDPDTGRTKLFHRLHDGDWAYESLQDCQPIADANAEARNHLSAWSPTREIKMTARVPLIFVEKFMRDHGLNLYSPDQDEQKRIDRLIDLEYPWMKV